MFTDPEAPASSEGSAEIGPPPFYHRSDCNICRQQDGLKTGPFSIGSFRRSRLPQESSASTFSR
jgi:hypothetical protein